MRLFAAYGKENVGQARKHQHASAHSDLESNIISWIENVWSQNHVNSIVVQEVGANTGNRLLCGIKAYYLYCE